MQKKKNRPISANFSWKRLLLTAFFSAYLYIFMEWLFIVTKPSFFSAITLLEKIRVLFFSAALLAIASLIPLLPLALLSALIPSVEVKKVLLNLGALIPSAILATLALLLIDNFTYTVFHFGIASSDGIMRGLYTLLYLFLFANMFLEVQHSLRIFKRSPRGSRQNILLAGALLVLLASVLLNYEQPALTEPKASPQKQKTNLPNIILLTADGLSASHVSAYGYERDTTPFLTELAKHSLVAENEFNNSSLTAGSVVSIYTSRYPTSTRLLLTPPDILRGQDAYEHLPNLLKELGYYNVQYTDHVHVDANLLNVLAGFDESNGKTFQQTIYHNWLSKYLKTNYSFFLFEISNRVSDRLLHIFFVRRMVTQAEATFGDTRLFDDQNKMDRILAILRDSQQPVFAHLHWLGTHGPRFAPRTRTYSKGKVVNTQAYWDEDFYDDSIIDFDLGVRQLVEQLQAMGKYDNTILIVGTDHSQNYFANKRLPLIMHFPKDQYQQRIQSNVQNIDIAPTVLEYLGVEQPQWMQGSSVLTRDPGQRPIFAGWFNIAEDGAQAKLGTGWIKPPFYQFGFVSVIYCEHWYKLDLRNYRWESGPVAGQTGACGSLHIADETAFLLIRDRLKADGFDVSTLADFSKISKVAQP